jgi:hypothetical protein
LVWKISVKVGGVGKIKKEGNKEEREKEEK